MDSKLKLILAAMALMFGAACASESGGGGAAAVNAPAATPGTIVVPTPSPTPVSYYDGSTASLTGSNLKTELDKLFFNSNPNNPQNITININLARSTDAIIVSYTEGTNGQTVEAAFGTQHPTNGSVSDSSLNGWVNQGGKMVWKGFFQDLYGAVVLVIDSYVSQGDGQAGNILGGRLYFQNFNRYYPNNPQQGPLKMCWQIQLGPYDCRTFLVGDTIDMTSSLNPPPGNHGPDANMSYELLGSFVGIFKDAAGF